MKNPDIRAFCACVNLRYLLSLGTATLSLVFVQQLCQLLQIAKADRAFALLSGPMQYRHQYRHQYRNDSYYHQKLY